MVKPNCEGVKRVARCVAQHGVSHCAGSVRIRQKCVAVRLIVRTAASSTADF